MISLDDTIAKLKNSKVALIGAGGIGCELLKNLVLMGYGEVHVVDLDTIDLSNLNRQFLFRNKDIKKPKANTAARAVENFNFKKTKLVSYMANIMDFELEWFSNFDFVFNALDNIAARSYVNKMCLFSKIPCIDTGTTGFEGQVITTFPGETECYECTGKETPKTFPVCTIRSTPSQPVHCVTWSKNYLFGQLFGESEDAVTHEFGTDNEEEIKNLIKEQNELLDLKKQIKDENFYERVIEKIFIKDINKLLLLSDLWKTRRKPVPLQWSEELKQQVLAFTPQDISRNQDVLSIEKYLYMLIQSIETLQQRLKEDTETVLEFDKDDEAALNFVAASANIRSYIFGIPLKSKFDIKQIAGNIIPAVATANSIMAGFSALESINFFNPNPKNSMRAIYAIRDFSKILDSSMLDERNPSCKSCSIPKSILKVRKQNFDEVTLNDLINELVEKFNYSLDSDTGNAEIAIIVGKDKLVYDIDFDDNKSKTLKELGIGKGTFIIINDENDKKESLELYVDLVNDTLENNLFVEGMELPGKRIEAKQHESQDQNSSVMEAVFFEGGDDVIEITEEDNSLSLKKSSELETKKKRSLEVDLSSEENLAVKKKKREIEELDVIFLN